MHLVTRAATPAAVLLLGAVLVGISAPGFAQQLDSASRATLDVLTLPQLPAAPEPVQAAPAPANAAPAVVQDDDDDDYDSLAEAVAAQSVAADDGELRCLAAGVYFESKGEPLAGQLAVAQTILNRTRSGRFPKSVCSVLTQRGQFSFVRGGQVPSGSGRAWSTAIAVAKVAQRDLWDSAAGNALYFHARSVAPGWRLAKVAAIGNHVFYR